MSTFKHILGIAATLLLVGCIKNDIPYPRIQPNFTAFVVEGQTQAANIDTINRTVTVFLGEGADIYNVRVDSFAISPGYLADSLALAGTLNLSSSLDVDLELYQTYTWTISASQTIERYFTVASQVGASVIDVPAHRVVAYVAEGCDLTKLQVQSIKLGSTESTMTPDLNGRIADFSHPVEVTVTDYGRETVWTIYVTTTDAAVTTSRVDAWTNVAWLYGEAEVGKDNGFEYRLASDDTWTRVPSDWVTHDGGSFTARLIHLLPETDYVARAYSDEDYGAEIPFTTESIAELPNGSMDNWWLDGKVWCPWAEGGTPYWDTGNKGATTLGSSNSVPTTDTSSGSGRAAMLQTKFVGIGVIGKLAAGNLFIGKYVRTDGTNGVLAFGQEFTLRPTYLKGYMKYHSAPISSTTTGFTDWKDRPDTAAIWIALLDCDEPYEIRTNPSNRRVFDPNGPEVVAYGALNYGYDVTEYTPFTIELKYVATNRKPKYIVVVASASKYGDYFTGGDGSVLYVDDFVLEYDY